MGKKDHDLKRKQRPKSLIATMKKLCTTVFLGVTNEKWNFHTGIISHSTQASWLYLYSVSRNTLLVEDWHFLSGQGYQDQRKQHRAQQRPWHEAWNQTIVQPKPHWPIDFLHSDPVSRSPASAFTAFFCVMDNSQLLTTCQPQGKEHFIQSRLRETEI